jgi:ribosomal protein S6
MLVTTVIPELQRQLNLVLNVQRATIVRKEQSCQQLALLVSTLLLGRKATPTVLAV